MLPLTEVERVVTAERHAVTPLPSTTEPIESPFPVNLPAGGTVELARLTIDLRRDRDAVLLLGTVNWSASFSAEIITRGGSADVTFELLRDGAVIYRVTQSAVQLEVAALSRPVSAAAAVFQIASLRHLDTTPLTGKTNCVTYTLRATNIILVKPDSPDEQNTVTAEAGAVTLTAQEIEAPRPHR